MQYDGKTFSSTGYQITLDDLKSFLWGAATRLRGQIDAAGYKEYIFPLLFFKRISDVYDEQFEGFVHEGGVEYAAMQAEELTIRIPDGAHWKDVRAVTENVGQRLVEAFIAIEQANPGVETDGRIVGGLDGIFGPKDGWTNKAKMPDAIITDLIEEFSKYNLSLAACPADEMGQAYEYLVGKFADDAGNTAQEFYTNRTVVTLMAEILQPKPDESIYDPTCGSGGMLVKCLSFLRDKGEPWQGVKVFGQEINALTSAIARMNLYLNGVEDFSIANSDTLENPKFFDGSMLRKFDIVLANPPYSIKQWNRDAFVNDKYGRNMWGAPIQARADYAFIQHIVASMDERSGRCAILLPHGVLNREEDKAIRIEHIKSDTIEAIIGLGRNLFYNSGLESFIFICRNKKTKARRNKILFIEAEKCTHKKGKQAFLFDEDIQKILNAYHSNQDIDGFSKLVDIKDVLSNEGNLNIKSYVKSCDDKNDLELKDSLQSLDVAQTNLSEALNNFSLVEENFPRVSFKKSHGSYDKTSWPVVKLSDVAEEYSIRVENPSQSEYDFFIGSDCIGQYDFRIHKKSPANIITSTQKGFKKNDYLLVRRSLYGSDFRERAPRADFDGTCSADILTIREKSGVIEDGFLIYVLYQKSLWDFIVSNSNGGLTRRIKWKQLADYEFQLPPKKIQKEIAKKLWAAYQLKQSYKKLLAATDEVVKSRFIEMFKSSNTFVSEGTLADFCLLKAGKGVKSEDIHEHPLKNADIPCYGGNGLRGYVSDYSHEGSFNLIGRQGALCGNVVLAKGRFYATEHAVVVTPKTQLNEIWLYYALKEMRLNQYARGVAQPGLAVNQLEKLPFGIPSNDSQESFAQIVKQADKSGFELRKSIESIDAVIKSLINN